MERGNEYADWATLHQSERYAETRGLAAGYKGRGETAVCPQTTEMNRRKRNKGAYQCVAPPHI